MLPGLSAWQRVGKAAFRLANAVALALTQPHTKPVSPLDKNHFEG